MTDNDKKTGTGLDGDLEVVIPIRKTGGQYRMPDSRFGAPYIGDTAEPVITLLQWDQMVEEQIFEYAIEGVDDGIVWLNTEDTVEALWRVNLHRTGWELWGWRASACSAPLPDEDGSAGEGDNGHSHLHLVGLLDDGTLKRYLYRSEQAEHLDGAERLPLHTLFLDAPQLFVRGADHG